MMFISVFKSEIPSERLVVTSSCYSNDIKEDLTLLLVALFQPIRQGGLSGFSKSLHGALDWSKKHVEDNLCTTSLSQQYPHPSGLTPTPPNQKKYEAIKLWNAPAKEPPTISANQYNGRVGVVRGICMQSFMPLDSALLLNGKGYRVWTFCCCGVPGHGMHATVHVIFHSSSQSASFGVWCT